MGVKTTFRLGEFIENIEGTVANPDNALGLPDESFTGNTSGSWAAKWYLQPPEEGESATLTPVVPQSLKIHCRRVGGADAEDPIIDKVIIRDHLERPVYEYVSSVQLNRWLGPFSPTDYWMDMKLRKALWKGTPLPPDSPSGQDSLGCLVFSRIDPDGTAYAVTQLAGLVKYTGLNTENPQVARRSATPSHIDAGLAGDREIILSPDETLIAYRENGLNFPNRTGISYEVEVDGQPRYAVFPTPTARDDIAFSPCSNYVLLVAAADDTKFASLYSVDREAGTLTDVSPAFMTSGTSLGTSSNRKSCAWLGNLAVVSNRTGFSAYEWDPTTETFSEIAEAQSFQFSPTQAATAISLSPNGRFVAIVCRVSRELRVFDMENLGAGWRSVEYHNQITVDRLPNRAFWHPDGDAVFISLNESSGSNGRGATGATVCIHVPESGTLSVVSPAPVYSQSWEPDFPAEPMFPLSASPVGSFDFTSNKVTFIGPNLDRDGDTSDRVGVLDRVSPSRNKDVVTLSHVWGPAVMSGRRLPFNYRGASPSDHVSLGFVTAAISTLGGGNDRQQYMSPCGRYITYHSSGMVRVAKFDSYLEDLSKCARAYPPLTFASVSAVPLPGAHWSFDGRYFVSGNYLAEVDYDAETITQLTVPADFVGTRFRFRPCMQGDPHPYVIMVVTDDTLDPGQYHRMFEIIDGEVVRNSDLDLPSPPHNFNLGEDVFHTSFSNDGEYLVVAGRWSDYSIWRWNSGSPNLALTDDHPSQTGNSRMQTSWHPHDTNVVFVSDMSSDTTWPYPSIRLYRIHEDSVQTFDNESAMEHFNESAGPNSIAFTPIFTPDGRYIFLRPQVVPASGTGSLTGGARDTDANGFLFFEWDIDRYNSGLRIAPNYQDNTFLAGRGTGLYGNAPLAYYESFDGRIVRIRSPSVGPNSIEYVLQGTHKDIDPTTIVYDAGWTVEVYTKGSTSNAVQLEAIELELEMDKYLLPAPSNLQVISITGSSALVSWEWEPEE